MQALVLFVVVVAGLFGLLIGSFLNVVAYRVPAGSRFFVRADARTATPPSGPGRTFPLSRGSPCAAAARRARQPISVRYPIVEAVTGVAFAGVTWWWLVASSPIRRRSATKRGR